MFEWNKCWSLLFKSMEYFLETFFPIFSIIVGLYKIRVFTSMTTAITGKLKWTYFVNYFWRHFVSLLPDDELVSKSHLNGLLMDRNRLFLVDFVWYLFTIFQLIPCVYRQVWRLFYYCFDFCVIFWWRGGERIFSLMNF